MFKTRRELVLQEMTDKSIAVIYSDFPLCPDFFYLTGIQRNNMALVLAKNGNTLQSILFIQKPDPFTEKWNGKLMRNTEAKEISQIDDIRYIEGLDSAIMLMLSRQGYEKMYFDLSEFNLNPNKNLNTQKAKLYKDSFPTMEIANIWPIVGTLRMQKDEYEISKVKEAIHMTKNGLCEVLKTLKPGLYEYQVQATYEYSIKYQGSIKPSFPTIAGAGYNGTMLHYGTNRDLIKDGDLILLDLGSMADGYCSDITRTYPANGKFSPRQKQIYDIVLKANQTIKDVAKPGMTLVELNEITKKVLGEGLIEIGLIKSMNELPKYYMHSVSHHLGIEVHDVTIATNDKLRPGAIISNEPGLYIEEECIGIRIEDDLLITEDGCIVLSEDVIRTTEEIEEYMAKHNPHVK